MPLNTADISFDATFDNIKSSLDTIVPMGQDLLCLKRETDKLVPIEPAVISEKAELLVRSHTFRSKRFRDIAIFSENVVGVTPKACPIIENRRKPCKFKCFNISDYPEVTPVPVLIGKDIITGETQALLAVGARSFTRSEEIGLFSRKVYCGHCNKLMRTGRSKRKSGTYYNYVICVRRHPEINPCPVHAVSNALMEKTILDQLDILAAKYKDGSLFSEIMDEESTIGIEIKRLKAELAQHKKKLVEYETGLKCLYLDKASGSISNSDYQFLSRELSAGKELAERKVDLCTENYNKILRSQEILREKAGVLESYSRPKELTRSMVETFIDHIVICSSSDGTSKQEIKIYWNF